MHGWRARIGLMVPAVNNTMECELWSMVPKGVTVSTARIACEREGAAETLRGMEQEGKNACARVMTAEPDLVLFGCTSASFYEGPDWNREFQAALTDMAGVPAITTTGAMVEALRRDGIRTVDVITPYVETTNERLRRYLEAEGVGVKSFGSFDMLDMFDHARIQPGDVYRKVRDCASDDADAVFIACTQVRALEVVDVLERDLGKPVYTANQCSFWKAFETLGVTPDVEGVGGALMRSLRGGASASPARKIA
ncbi:MAG: maleate cis-trans isomerase [Rhodospirillaceae bacterium]|jgi:maleate cis-trans isomerase|nr:maleate cis-trans isomerase [Rhodospirillaceae bacterium]MBT5666926.1 maleate cis-trans isomerase [Rhodospirillaceae bacterium]MBT5809930.1 maleate cis-trans isomerase [Rhodospirillaceae bacterium]